MHHILIFLVSVFASLHCASGYAAIPLPTSDFTQAEKGEARPGGATSHKHRSNRHSFSNVFANVSLDEGLDFQIGKAIFEKLWVFSPSSTTASDGLGPLYNARSCARCHKGNGRGSSQTLFDNTPNQVAHLSLLFRLSRPSDHSAESSRQRKTQGFVGDPMYGSQLQSFAWPNGNAEGQVLISYDKVQQSLNGEKPITLRKPRYQLTNLGYGPLHPETTLGARFTPPLIGLGLLNAISNQDLDALSDPNDEDNNGISGKINRVWDPITKTTQYGRFGWKASAASLTQQNLSALNDDIGINSWLFTDPYGNCTKAQTSCREQAHGNTDNQDGFEASKDVTRVLNYFTENLAVPIRYRANDPDVLQGKQQFYTAGCTQCHQPSFVLEENANSKLATQKIWPYTDLLLHDMGPELADQVGVFDASGSEWRTPPLWGIGLTKTISGTTLFLHDGRAKSLLEAILWHGGEAQAAKNAVVAMTPTERQQLITFLESL